MNVPLQAHKCIPGWESWSISAQVRFRTGKEQLDDNNATGVALLAKFPSTCSDLWSPDCGKSMVTRYCGRHGASWGLAPRKPLKTRVFPKIMRCGCEGWFNRCGWQTTANRLEVWQNSKHVGWSGKGNCCRNQTLPNWPIEQRYKFLVRANNAWATHTMSPIELSAQRSTQALWAAQFCRIWPETAAQGTPK